MPTRIKDVAKRAGVSAATISHVMNKTRYVAPETTQRVLDAIHELKYYKNLHARRLVRGGSDFFGLIVSDIENPFFPELIKGFEMEAVKRGFDILLCATNYDRDRAQAAVGKMIENMVRGVAVMTMSVDRTFAEELKANQVPVVFLGLGLVETYVSNIRVDFAPGTAQAIDHLCDLGHRNFAFIAGPQDRRSFVTQQHAFREALKQRGLSSDQIVVGNNKVEGGIAAVRTFLTQPSLPSAILCSSDLTAIGAITALEEAGLRVPGDVSVVGSDDIQFARLSRPSLTTIRLPRDVLGKLAFDALERMLHSKRHLGKEYVLDTELIVRQSTGEARKEKEDLPTRLGTSVAPSAGLDSTGGPTN